MSDPGWLLTGEGNPEREKPKVSEDQVPRPEETGLDHPLGEEAEKEMNAAMRSDQQIYDIIRALQGDRELRNVLLCLVECKKDFDRASNIIRDYIGKQVNLWFAANGEKDRK